jgi:hypothetical protein
MVLRTLQTDQGLERARQRRYRAPGVNCPTVMPVDAVGHIDRAEAMRVG